MAFDIQEFRAQLQYDGYRPTMFQVTNITNPADNSAVLKIPYMVKAASIPGYRLGVIKPMYFGRAIGVAGDRDYETWTVQVICDEDFLIRDGMENWSNLMNSFQTNIRNVADGTSTAYKTNAIVSNFAKTGVPIRSYTFQGIWPINVGAIELNWENQNQIASFPVEFNVDWVEPSAPSTTGTAGGSF